MDNNQKQQQKIDLAQYEIQICGRPVILQLNRSFNTAHSSSTTRTNFIIKSSLKNSFTHQKTEQSKRTQVNPQTNQISVGYGECGLPPKKPYCYLADIEDCQAFMKKINLQLKDFHQQFQGNPLDPNLFVEFFRVLYIQVFSPILEQELHEISEGNLLFFRKKFNSLINTSDRIGVIPQMYFYMQVFFLFSKAQQISTIHHEYKAAKNALQFSLLDLIGKIQNKSVSELISGKKDHFKLKTNYSFYTISHEENLESMLQNGKDSMKFTNCIKIKFNNQVEKLIELLIMMDKHQVGEKWIVDANACWTPADYVKFQQKITEVSSQVPSIKSKILFIQQPFPIFKSLKSVKTSEEIIEQQNEWQVIKQSTSLIIIADQSFASLEDLDSVMRYSHGINIKMEKCGGPFEAIKTLNEVQKRKIEHVMFGSMVSTHLGCTQTFQFYQFAQYFDIDGALLVKEPQIRGGFEWKGAEGIVKVEGKGLALVECDIDRLF